MKNNKSKEVFEKNMTEFKSNIKQYKDNLKEIKENTKKSFNTENNKEYKETKIDKKFNEFSDKLDDEVTKLSDKMDTKLDEFSESCDEKLNDFDKKANAFFDDFGIHFKNGFFYVVGFFEKVIAIVKAFCKKGNGLVGILIIYSLLMLFIWVMYRINS